MPYVGKCYGINKVWKGIRNRRMWGNSVYNLNKFIRENLKN